MYPEEGSKVLSSVEREAIPAEGTKAKPPQWSGFVLILKLPNYIGVFPLFYDLHYLTDRLNNEDGNIIDINQ